MALLTTLKPYPKKGFPGVFYNDSRSWANPHRLGKDLHLYLRYTIGGKTRLEVWGWESQAGPASDALNTIRRYRENHKAGCGPTSLTEERAIRADEERQAAEETEKAERERLAREITFDAFWHNHYFPVCEATKKRGSHQAEHYLYTGWIKPVVGQMRLLDIRPLHLRKLRDSMAKAGRAPASIKYAFAVFQQVWNMARADGYVQGDSPSKDKTCKLAKFDNQKVRYLTPGEADALLAKLQEISPKVADMAGISLHCGLRAGELFGLTWADLDLDRGSLRLRDTKAGDSRTVPLTDTAKQVLTRRFNAEKDARRKAEDKGTDRLKVELVFPGRGGKQITSISATFDRAVNALKLNAEVTDRRQKLTFHSLRHSCASLLVQSGVPLYTVSKILGHKTMRMTERYSHLAQDDLRHALGNVDAALSAPAKAAKKSSQGNQGGTGAA